LKGQAPPQRAGAACHSSRWRWPLARHWVVFTLISSAAGPAHAPSHRAFRPHPSTAPSSAWSWAGPGGGAIAPTHPAKRRGILRESVLRLHPRAKTASARFQRCTSSRGGQRCLFASTHSAFHQARLECSPGSYAGEDPQGSLRGALRILGTTFRLEQTPRLVQVIETMGVGRPRRRRNCRR